MTIENTSHSGLDDAAVRLEKALERISCVYEQQMLDGVGNPSPNRPDVKLRGAVTAILADLDKILAGADHG